MDMKKAMAAAAGAIDTPEPIEYECRGCGKKIDWFGACDECIKLFDERHMNKPDRMEALGIPKPLLRCRWDNFEMPKGEKYAKLVDRIKILQDWVGIPRLVMLFGRPGTGKSHMAVATAWRRFDLKGPFEMRFVQERRLLEDLKRTFGDTEQRNEYRHQLEKVRFLIIDDLGQSRTTEFSVETIYGLVIQRFDEGRVTLVTTNLVPGDIDAIEPRLGSRLHEALLINTSSMLDRRKGN